MIDRPALAYAQARMQARLARLPTEADWRRLASTRSLAAYLEESRATGLGPWVRAFSRLSQPHELDRGCRAIARESTELVASWAPVAWRPAVIWIAWLPWLPLIEHLARGGTLPAWASHDERLRGWLDDSGALDIGALTAAGLDVADAGQCTEVIARRWGDAWRARWPTTGGRCRRDLEALAALVSRHVETFQGGGTESAWALREALHGRLWRLLHLRAVQPVALFAFLAILLIDLERLRGALLSRAVFGSSGVR